MDSFSQGHVFLSSGRFCSDLALKFPYPREGIVDADVFKLERFYVPILKAVLEVQNREVGMIYWVILPFSNSSPSKSNVYINFWAHIEMSL